MQHLHHFGRFEMNKGDLGRQREGRILVAEKKFFTKLMFVVWLRVQNAAQEIRRNRGILNRVRLSWAAACTANNTVFLLSCLQILMTEKLDILGWSYVKMARQI
jgi:hypothetical protein